jgi:hypothetical protein
MKSKQSKRMIPKEPSDTLPQQKVCIDKQLNTGALAEAASSLGAEQSAESVKEDEESFLPRQHRVRNRKEQFDALHQEMELVSYGISETGQSRRKFPRHLSAERTKKRRLLEQQDRESVNFEQNKTFGYMRTRRGSKAAAEDEVIRESLIYGPKPSSNDVDNPDEYDSAQDEDDFGTQTDPDDIDDLDQCDVDALVDLDDVDDLGAAEQSSKPSVSKRSSSAKFTKPKAGKISRVQRLRNFNSTRMAEKHGAALGAHIQGRPALAIRRLKQVATLAPSAPQIYSSLGMIYEDLLQESQRKYAATESRTSLVPVDDERKMPPQLDSKRLILHADSELESFTGERASFQGEGVPGTKRHASQVQESEVQDNVLLEQLNLAKKAYGSYHVAAILCKRDYSLWLRAADTAYEIAVLHTTIMKLPGVPKTVVDYHRGEKLRWLDDAKNDYQTADNLNPPGIEIPAKLAHVMIELGMLSEALTILTSLKSHVEFASSYRAWLLFADLMLRIGHECNQWNHGIQTNSNYMFRRWLRKLSASFDWKERRLQALSKALEAACGTECCRDLISWISHRVKQLKVPPSDNGDCMPVEDSPLNECNVNKEDVLVTDQPDDCSTLLDPIEHRSEVVQPLAASCRVVFSIASELMRHIIHMNLWDGGLFVAESVSVYLKKRQEMCNLRIQQKLDFDSSQQKPTSIFAMQPESYDIVDSGMENDVDGSSDNPLSDDEDWDNFCDDTDMLRPLRKGVLPPEIKFLYGLCLAGQGEKPFLAVTCIEAIGYLPMESYSFLEERVVDCGVVQDSQWIVCQEMMAQPYGRLASLALVFDVVSQKNLETRVASLLVPLFQRQILSLEENRLDAVALGFNGSADIVRNHRRNHVAKVLLASVRFEISEVESTSEHRYCGHNHRGSVTRCQEWINKLAKVVELAWRIEPDGTLEGFCVCIVDALARILRIYNDDISDYGTLQDITELEFSLSRVLQVIAVFSGVSSMSFEDEVDRISPELKMFPLTSTWLSSDLETIANRAFKLCVGLNVTHLSGWEIDTFSSRLGSGTGASNFLGNTTDDGPIAGFLLPSIEEELAAQWELVRTRQTKVVSFSFREKLLHLRESKWYAETRRQDMTERDNRSMIKQGAEYGLSALLGFSRLCLLLDHKDNEKSFLIALSILLPISQFCLKEFLWDAKIGQRSDTVFHDVGECLDFSNRMPADHVAPSNRPGYIRPSKRHLLKSSDSDGEKALHEWFSWENEHQPISNLLKIPLSRLLHQWHDSPEPANREGNIEVNRIMHDIDELMSQMRSCFTLHAVERTSIRIASNLLELIMYPLCRNPFLCIQQAAIFASLGPKGGTTYHLFQARLPKPDLCTSRKALLILGRAECLNALHFSLEASFLCCYVARVCGLHLNGNEAHKTSKRWHILGYLAYDLSVMIRITAGLKLQDLEKKDDTYGAWDLTVIDLFLLFRNGALSNKDRSGINPHGDHTFPATSLTPHTLPNLENDHERVTLSSKSSDDRFEPEIEASTVEMPHLVEV